MAVMSHVHSLRLGYLSGQLGLLRVPVGLWILCSHSAGHTHTHTHRKLKSWQNRKRSEEAEGEKDRMERNQRSKRKRYDFNETHPDDEFGVKITRMQARKGSAAREHKHTCKTHPLAKG